MGRGKGGLNGPNLDPSDFQTKAPNKTALRRARQEDEYYDDNAPGEYDFDAPPVGNWSDMPPDDQLKTMDEILEERGEVIAEEPAEDPAASEWQEVTNSKKSKPKSKASQWSKPPKPMRESNERGKNADPLPEPPVERLKSSRPVEMAIRQPVARPTDLAASNAAAYADKTKPPPQLEQPSTSNSRAKLTASTPKVCGHADMRAGCPGCNLRYFVNVRDKVNSLGKAAYETEDSLRKSVEPDQRPARKLVAQWETAREEKEYWYGKLALLREKIDYMQTRLPSSAHGYDEAVDTHTQEMSSRWQAVDNTAIDKESGFVPETDHASDCKPLDRANIPATCDHFLSNPIGFEIGLLLGKKTKWTPDQAINRGQSPAIMSVGATWDSNMFGIPATLPPSAVEDPDSEAMPTPTTEYAKRKADNPSYDTNARLSEPARMKLFSVKHSDSASRILKRYSSVAQADNNDDGAQPSPAAGSCEEPIAGARDWVGLTNYVESYRQSCGGGKQFTDGVLRTWQAHENAVDADILSGVRAFTDSDRLTEFDDGNGVDPRFASDPDMDEAYHTELRRVKPQRHR